MNITKQTCETLCLRVLAFAFLVGGTLMGVPQVQADQKTAAAAKHTPKSVCARVATLRKKKAPARSSKSCERAMTRLLARFPKRFHAFARCIHKQTDMAGFKKSCMHIMFGGRQAARRQMQRYLARTKESYAKMALFRLRSSISQFHLQHKRLPVPMGWFPKVPCCKQPGKKCTAPKALPADAKELFGKSAIQPRFFQYRFTRTGKGKGATFLLEAKGDPNCNGKTVLYVVKGSIGPSGSLHMTKPKRTTM